MNEVDYRKFQSRDKTHKSMYYVEYQLKESLPFNTNRSGPFEEYRTAEAFVIAFVNRNQVLWIRIIEQENP